MEPNYLNRPESEASDERTTDLPTEVHERIIGFLDSRSDVGTIANCALVCQRWLPFSRFKLYYLVELVDRQQWTSFKRLVLQPTSNVAWYLGVVRELRIWPSGDPAFFDKEGKHPRIGWGKGQERPWTHLVLLQCAARLVGLAHIKLSHVDWTYSFDLALRCGCYYQSLVRLEVQYCTFSSIHQLHHLVTAFPSLSDLILDGIKLQSLTLPSHIPKGGHPLTHLELDGQDEVLVPVSQWLASAQLIQSLTCLEWWRSMAAEDVWKTLTEAIDGPSLQGLILFEMPRSQQVDLSHFACLRVLKLHYGTLPIDEHLESLKGVLSSISSSQLEELCIFSYFNGDYSLESILDALSSLRDIDVILALPQFVRLRRVALDYAIEVLVQTTPIVLKPSLSPPSNIVVPSISSCVHSDPPNGPNNSHTYSLDVDPNDIQHPFEFYASDLVRRKIQEEMKQLNARGVLEIDLSIYAEDSSGTHTGLHDKMEASALSVIPSGTQAATFTHLSHDYDIMSSQE